MILYNKHRKATEIRISHIVIKNNEGIELLVLLFNSNIFVEKKSYSNGCHDCYLLDKRRCTNLFSWCRYRINDKPICIELKLQNSIFSNIAISLFSCSFIRSKK